MRRHSLSSSSLLRPPPAPPPPSRPRTFQYVVAAPGGSARTRYPPAYPRERRVTPLAATLSGDFPASYKDSGYVSALVRHPTKSISFFVPPSSPSPSSSPLSELGSYEKVAPRGRRRELGPGRETPLPRTSRSRGRTRRENQFEARFLARSLVGHAGPLSVG